MDLTSFLIGLGAWFFILSALLVFAAVLSAIGLWKVLERLGKPGWGALIPFYGTWLLASGSGLERNLAIACVACQALAFALALTGAGGAVALVASLASLAFVVLFAVACDKARRLFAMGPWMTALMVAVPFIGFPMAGFSGGLSFRERAEKRQMARSRKKEANARERALQKAQARPSVKSKGQGRPRKPEVSAKRGSAAKRAAPAKRKAQAAAASAPAGSARGQSGRAAAQKRFYESLAPAQQMEFDMLLTDAERSEFYKRTMAERANG